MRLTLWMGGRGVGVDTDNKEHTQQYKVSLGVKEGSREEGSRVLRMVLFTKVTKEGLLEKASSAKAQRKGAGGGAQGMPGQREMQVQRS